MSRFMWFACVLALLPAGAAAQMTVRSLEVSGGYSGWGGDDFDGFEAGPRGQLTLLLGGGERVTWGVIGTYGRGGFDGVDADYQEIGFAGIARTLVDVGSALDFYATLQAGWTRLSADLKPVLPDDIESNGFEVGPSLGLEIPAGRVGITLGGEVTWRSMGELRFSGSSGPNLGGGGAKGWRYGAEAGLRFRMGD